MTNEYTQPAEGRTSWHVPLNENFAALETDVTGEVQSFGDLPDPDGTESSNGNRRTVLVREDRVVYRDAGDAWEAIAGLGADATRVVGARGGFATIEDALRDVPAGENGRVLVTQSYDPSGASSDGSGESFPIEVTQRGIAIEGDGMVDIVNDTGADTLHLNPGNERPPGITVRDLSITNTAGGRGVFVENSKFNYFENVHVDGDDAGSAAGWSFGTAASQPANNTQMLVYCTAEHAGGDGFHLGGATHHALLYGCTALYNARIGVYANGPYDVRLSNCQLEDNGAEGLKARVADQVTVTNSYVESNVLDGPTSYDADIAFADSGGCGVDGAWFNGKDVDGEGGPTTAAVAFVGDSPSGSVRRLSANGEYEAVVATESADTEIAAQSHDTEASSTVRIEPDARRVRSNGTIVGAGTSQGGNGDRSGVDLGEVSGVGMGDVAVADGSAATAFVQARWTGTEWQPSDGGGTIEPSG